MTNTEGGTDDEEFRVAAVKDRVDTTMDVWMGLTIGCAKCHSHKFDPITQKEYYQFVAIFNQTADNDQPDESPTISFPSPATAREAAAIDVRIAALKKRLSAVKDKKTIKKQIAALQRIKPQVPTVPVMRELPPSKHRKTHVMIKGNFLVTADEVGPGVPAFFGSLPKNVPADRLAMARWLVSRDNPLTARVAVNRVWSQLFGQGLVETEEDFGTQGKPPEPSRTARLAGRRLHGSRLGHQVARPPASSRRPRIASRPASRPKRSRRIPAIGCCRAPRVFGSRPKWSAIRRSPSSGLLSDKMKGPSVFPPQPSRPVAGRLQRPRPGLDDESGRRPLSPRALHVLAADDPLSVDDHVRRPQPRNLLGPPHPHEYAAAGVRDAQ